MIALRRAPSARQAEEWALVLAAAGIPHRIRAVAGGWVVLVPDGEARRASEALEGYDAEAIPTPAPAAEEAGARRQAWIVAVTAAGLLLAFFAVTGRPAVDSRWFLHGAAWAGAMPTEPWRAVTALTLHVDAVHVASNAAAVAVLLPPVLQRLGPGYGLTLVLLAGAAGNVLAALVHEVGHVAVGASTATFGAIGLLAALRRFPAGADRTRGRPWMLLAASMVLLALLGAGADADVLGHVFGLLAGGILGLVTGAVGRRPGRRGQGVLLALAPVLVAACWHLALGAGA